MRRLILFDIDGTLLKAGGAGKRAVHDALVEVFGTTGPIGSYSFAGRTDPEIVTHLMREAGLAQAEIEAGLPRLWRLYTDALAREITGARVEALPGVPEILDRIEDEGGHVVLGILTGNVIEGARLKVDAAGLGFERFRVGAYGSDHAERPELPAVAVRRARELLGVDFAGKEIVIVGDTPKDVACGERLGVRTIATATGEYDVGALAACDPDYVFPDLADTSAVWRAIVA